MCWMLDGHPVLPSLTVTPLPETSAYDTTWARISQYLTSVSGGIYGQTSQGSAVSDFLFVALLIRVRCPRQELISGFSAAQ